jgi:formylglycine-generating enzyme required for sulfatase activity
MIAEPSSNKSPGPSSSGPPSHADDMVLLPGGAFAMGTRTAEIPRLQARYGVRHAGLLTPEVPRHPVRLDPFYIDRYEVTNAQFRAFLVAQPAWRPDCILDRYHNGDYLKHWQGNDYPPGKARHPVVCVSWYAAMAYAHWAGKWLPTEAEWEYAARGGLSGAEFPWGDEPPDPDRANYAGSELGDTTPVGSYPANAYGLHDMAGNVWEYCLDEWDERAYTEGPEDNPVAGGSLYPGETYLGVTTRRVIRGGSWGGAPVNLRVAYRDSHPPDGAGPHVGFRCARPA